MRVFVGLAVLILVVATTPASAQEKPRGPYDRVAPGKPPAKESKVYTNADLARLLESVEDADREKPADAVPGAEKAAEGKTAPGQADAPVDPLIWLQQRQLAEREHREAVTVAEAALAAARQRLADLQKQWMATRNPFAARPTLSDEEKAERSKSSETAAERHERTEQLVKEASAAVSAAEAELARVRAGRP